MAYQHDTRRPESHNPKREVPYLVRWERKRYLKTTTTTTPMLFFVFFPSPHCYVYTLRNWLRQKGQCWWPWLRKPCFGLSSTQNTGGCSTVVALLLQGSDSNCCCSMAVETAGGKSVQSGHTITWQTGANRLCFRWALENDQNRWGEIGEISFVYFIPGRKTSMRWSTSSISSKSTWQTWQGRTSPSPSNDPSIFWLKKSRSN